MKLEKLTVDEIIKAISYKTKEEVEQIKNGIVEVLVYSVMLVMSSGQPVIVPSLSNITVGNGSVVRSKNVRPRSIADICTLLNAPVP